jgi:SAM-dependent methyltransferase
MTTVTGAAPTAVFPNRGSTWRRGWDLYWFTSALGVGRFVPRMNLVRFHEYALVVEGLALTPSCRLLDVGSGYSILPLYLAARYACRVHITDSEANLSGVAAFHARKLARLPAARARVIVERQDARQLTYPGHAFDRVSSVSVLEHIPDDGDSDAMRQIGRVLAPGGVAAITVPYAPKYEERESSPWVEYFERSYDDAAIERRLVAPSGLNVRSRLYFGERPNPFARWYYRDVPWPLRTAAEVAAPAVSAAVSRSSPVPFVGAYGVLLVLTSPAATQSIGRPVE